MIKFLLDIGISPLCGKWLKSKGYDSVHLSELSLHKLHDMEIIELAKKENRVILTCDNDFGTLLAFGKNNFPSIIFFRLNDFTPTNICQKLEIILKEIEAKQLIEGIFITVKEHNYRTRILPIIKPK